MTLIHNAKIMTLIPIFYSINISLFLFLQTLNAKVLLIASVFRHSERLSYIDFSSNKRNDNALTQIGKLTAYEAGKKFIYLNNTLQQEFIQTSDITCYQESIDSPRTIQTLAYRLGGMLNVPFKHILNNTTSFYEEFNGKKCNLKPKTLNLFPQKECKRLFDQQLSLNKKFIDYAKSILDRLRHNELLIKYLNSHSYYKDKESMYDKLNLIADYLSVSGREMRRNNSKEEKDEDEMRNVFNNYQEEYFNAVLDSNKVIEVMVAKYFQLLIKEIDQLLESKPDMHSSSNDNRVKYLLFSSHEFSLLFILKSLDIIDKDKPKIIKFNDELNLSVIHNKNKELYIVLYYNKKMIQMELCDIYCPYDYFKQRIINKYLLVTDAQINSLCSQSTSNDEL